MAELDRAAISIRMGESREQAGFTQPEIAELLRVHFRSVQDWESPKKRTLPFDRLEEWARLTGTTREWLLYGEQDQFTVLEARVEALQEGLSDVHELRVAVERIEELVLQLLARTPGAARAPSDTR